LSGATSLLAGQNPMVLLIETLGGGTFGRDQSESEKRLERLGFARCSYNPWKRMIKQSSDPPIYNHLFIRDIEFARARVTSAPHFGIGFGAI
jgi:hypothetical protein